MERLRNLLKDLTKQVAGAMVVFVQGDKRRFSYISKRKVKNKGTNEIQDKETAPATCESLRLQLVTIIEHPITLTSCFNNSAKPRVF